MKVTTYDKRKGLGSIPTWSELFSVFSAIDKHLDVRFSLICRKKDHKKYLGTAKKNSRITVYFTRT